MFANTVSQVRVINAWCLLFCITVPFLSQGTQSILEEESHIKDVLSRIVVEMIKREWPQHWPDMLKELDTLSKQGVWNTAVWCLLLALSVGFILPSSWKKSNSLIVKWDRLVMDSKIPVRLICLEMTSRESAILLFYFLNMRPLSSCMLAFSPHLWASL